MKEPTLLAIGDVENLLGVSRQYINRLAREKRLKCQKTSAGKIFFEDDVLAFKHERERRAKKDPRIKLKRK